MAYQKNRWVDLNRLKYWDENPNEGDIGAIMTSIRRRGLIAPIQIWKDYRIQDGNHRVRALRFLLKEDWEPFGECIRVYRNRVQVMVVDISHMTEKEAKAAGISLNRTARLGRDDPNKMHEHLVDLKDDPDLLLSTGWDYEAMDDLIDLADPMADPVESEWEDPGPPEWLEQAFPSSNRWGIPDLDLAWQATAVVYPVQKWGVIGRTDTMEGTYHFYTDDYKFAGLVNRPDKLLTTGCKVACEINNSTYPEMPLAIVIGEIYLKRWLSCLWGSQGVKLLVDLNVEPEFDMWNLRGVPHGWKAYCIRALTDNQAHLKRAYRVACEQAGTDDILFVVVGGRETVAPLCKHYGWVHLPEHHAVVHGEV